MKKNTLKYKRSKKEVIIGISTIVAMYLVIAMFFINHFYWGSQINGIDLSCKALNEANEEILRNINNYALELHGRDGVTEKIKSVDIGLVYDQVDKIKSFKATQNPMTWILGVFNKDYSKTEILANFNSRLLEKEIDKMTFFNGKDVIEPKDAKVKYTKQGYEIVEEVNGNKINKERLYKSVEEAILQGKEVLNLDEMNCYEAPRYTSKSKEVIEATNILNKYVAIKITYNVGNMKEVVDGSITNQWFYVDKNMNIEFDEKQVRKYVDSLAEKYNTFGQKRNFIATSGKPIQVCGGNYGWIINKNKEVKELVEGIKKGVDIIKQPAYSQTAFIRGNNDIGSTYVEINISRQHLWFYKNGNLIVDGDVVTGNPKNNYGTPTGTYRLNYKERKATLKGTNYRTLVDFWMPFNGNIGLHDATWRSEFGNDIYIENGSHGCINAPHGIAKIIFDNIQPGTPVICYKE